MESKSKHEAVEALSLAPNEYVQKALISTTSRMSGNYKTEHTLVARAWPSLADQSARFKEHEGPASRSAYVMAFRTPPYKGPGSGLIIPDYSYAADVFCSFFCLLFGKRFDFHGLYEGSGLFRLPDMSGLGGICVPMLPHNSHKLRADYSFKLELNELYRINKWLEFKCVDTSFEQYFFTAVRFYARGLRAWDNDPESAYLNFVTAGEVLSGFCDYSKSDLIDSDSRAILDAIETHVPDGKEVSKKLVSKLHLIKRRFVRMICDSVDDAFFLRSESRNADGAFSKSTFERSIAAAYDLRSTHVHTGVGFRGWVSVPTNGNNNEVPGGGKPVVDDKNFAKVLERAPTLVGIERVVRFCLLRLAERQGALDASITEETANATSNAAA